MLAHLDELGPAFEIGLQPAERYFGHSELEPQAIEEEPVVDNTIHCVPKNDNDVGRYILHIHIGVARYGALGHVPPRLPKTTYCSACFMLEPYKV